METVRKIPGRSRVGPKAIVQSSCEKYFPTTFYHFFAKYAREHEYYRSQIYNQHFTKTVRKVPGRPHEGPKTVVQSSGEKYFTPNFIIFGRNIFHHFDNLLRQFSTLDFPREHTLQKPFNILTKPFYIAKIKSRNYV